VSVCDTEKAGRPPRPERLWDPLGSHPGGKAAREWNWPLTSI